MALAFSEACERNKKPILDVLKRAIGDRRTVLEIGSGTGQHVVYFAGALPATEWQPTDRKPELAPLTERLVAEAPGNVRAPLPLDVHDRDWPGRYDVVFSANTLHIMSWNGVTDFFHGIGRVLMRDGLLIVYGPFLYEDVETVASNVAFDRWLRDRDPESGIRSLSAVDALAAEQGLTLGNDHAMPANNRLLVWRRH